MPDTPTAQLVGLKLEEDLDEYVQSRRATGRSWRLIAMDIYDATGVLVSPETLRRLWFPAAGDAA